MSNASFLTSDEIDNLFMEGEDEEPVKGSQEEPSGPEENAEETKTETTEIDPDTLFEEQSESVGSDEEDVQGKKENTSATKSSTSPNNVFSSIATAMVDGGVTPDLDASKVTDAESLRVELDKYVSGLLDERQRRIEEALNNGVETDTIKSYENTINQLNSISEDYIEDENNEEFRKRLIYQDFINKGYSKEEAEEELEEILNAGTDIRKAKRALTNMKDFYRNQYQQIREEAKAQTAKEQEELKKNVENLKKEMLDNNTAFGDFEISKENRQKAFDAITKPVWKDPETGDYLTAIQKYERENRTDFMKKLGIVFALTDGFKSLDVMIKNKVNKAKNKAFADLETKLSNTRRDSYGNLEFASGKEDPESFFSRFSVNV